MFSLNFSFNLISIFSISLNKLLLNSEPNKHFIEPVKIIKLVYNEIKHPTLELFNLLLLMIVVPIIIVSVAIILDKIGITGETQFGLFLILLGVSLVIWILEAFFNIHIKDIIYKLKIDKKK